MTKMILGAITGARVSGPAEFEYAEIVVFFCLKRLDRRIRVYPTVWGACVGPQKLTSDNGCGGNTKAISMSMLGSYTHVTRIRNDWLGCNAIKRE